MQQEPTPALDRGIQIIRLLKDRPPLKLEEVSSLLSLPKASVSRLLWTLEQAGVVTRDPNSKRYRALQMLSSIHDPLSDVEIQRHLDALSACTQRRAEFYRCDENGSTITHVSSPLQQEVSVTAQIGFVRNWSSELDAVCAIGHAFFSHAPTLSRSIHQGGCIAQNIRLSPREAKSHIASLVTSGAALDEDYNANGVRRLAAPLIYLGEFRGIVALAETSLGQHGISFTEAMDRLKGELARWTE
jgi:DNA-binding IclR family transcriptional regulator